jgi:dipeptide/tripeptide permease
VRHADRKQSQGGEQQAVTVTEDLPPTPEATAMAAVPEWKRILALIVIFLIVIVFWMVFHRTRCR